MPLKRNRSSSQLNKLEGGTYNFTRFNYPADGLASDKIPNYVIFYINVPEAAKYNVTKAKASNGVEVLSNSDKMSRETRGSDKLLSGENAGVTGVAVAGLDVAKTLVTGGVDSVDLTKSGTRGILGATIASVANDVVKRPKYNRIRTAIAMYMPDTVLQTFAHDYDAISIRDALGDLGLAQRGGTDVRKYLEGAAGSALSIAEGTATEFKVPVAGPAFSEVAGRLAEQTGLVNQGFTELVLRGSGQAINPQIEMVYKQTRNRSFVFDFRLQPRSSLESRNIKNIIREFKRYAAPSLGGGDGSYFTIPGQFDIQFMFKNEENRFIGKLSTCALENIDVNYSSAGPFATFDDGAPVEIALQLRFIEVDTITKEVFEGDGGNVDTSYADGPSF